MGRATWHFLFFQKPGICEPRHATLRAGAGVEGVPAKQTLSSRKPLLQGLVFQLLLYSLSADASGISLSVE